MFSHNISPIIFRIGSIQVTYYALVYLFATLIILYILLKFSEKEEIHLTENQVYDLVFFLIIGVIIGARIFHILFWDFQYFSQNAAEIPKVWKGGLSFHGGLTGGILVLLIYTKIKKISFLKIADIITIPAIFFLALGRIANFINQEIVGTITNLPWCFNFKYQEGCRHPIQLYAAAGRLILFVFLFQIKKLKAKQGTIFWMFITLVGAGRFTLDFLREGVKYSGLLAGQWLSIVMIVTGIYALTKTTSFSSH